MLTSLQPGELSRIRHEEIAHKIRKESFSHLVELLSITSPVKTVEQPRFDLSQLKTSSVDERKPTKEMCGLCTHYYDKSSVVYRVANYRILAQLKAWNYPLEGKRYAYPSFTYSTSKLCCFCAQLISDYDDGEQAEQSQLLKRPSTSSSVVSRLTHASKSTTKSKSAANVDIMRYPIEQNKIKFAKVTLRKDLAKLQKCYQSTVSDNYGARNCVTYPYVHLSKTLRELDPWWELDFSDFKNIHSVQFVLAQLVKNISSGPVFVCFLTQPIGFENPFLEHVKQQAVLWTELQPVSTSSNDFGVSVSFCSSRPRLDLA